MTVLMIEYRLPTEAVSGYADWKTMFDADPFDRKAYGVIRHCIYQSSDDVNHLMVSLEFSSAEAAKTFVEALQPVWGASGAGQAWVLQDAAAATY